MPIKHTRGFARLQTEPDKVLETTVKYVFVRFVRDSIIFFHLLRFPQKLRFLYTITQQQFRKNRTGSATISNAKLKLSSPKCLFMVSQIAFVKFRLN